MIIHIRCEVGGTRRETIGIILEKLPIDIDADGFGDDPANIFQKTD